MVGVAVVVLVVLAATFAFVYHSTGSQLKRQIDRSIRSSAIELRDTIRGRHDGSAEGGLGQRAPVRRIPALQGLSRAAVHADPGRGQRQQPSRAVRHVQARRRVRPSREQAAENVEGRRLAVPHAGYNTLPGPDIGDLRLYEVRFKVAGVTAYSGAAEPLASVDHAQEVVRHSFELAARSASCWRCSPPT